MQSPRQNIGFKAQKHNLAPVLVSRLSGYRKAGGVSGAYLLDDQRRAEIFSTLEPEAQIGGVPLVDAHGNQGGHVTLGSRAPEAHSHRIIYKQEFEMMLSDLKCGVQWRSATPEPAASTVVGTWRVLIVHRTGVYAETLFANVPKDFFVI